MGALMASNYWEVCAVIANQGRVRIIRKTDVKSSPVDLVSIFPGGRAVFICGEMGIEADKWIGCSDQAP